MEAIPRISQRRILSANRFFDLIEEHIEDRDGKPYPYYTVASKWDAVLVVPLLPDGRVIVERIYRHPYGAWFHEFPAGGIEPGEDPIIAGARELREETGWIGTTMTPLTSFEALPGLLRLRLHVVLAEGLTLAGPVAHEAAEFIQVSSLSIDDAWQTARAAQSSSFLTYGLMALELRHRLEV